MYAAAVRQRCGAGHVSMRRLRHMRHGRVVLASCAFSHVKDRRHPMSHALSCCCAAALVMQSCCRGKCCGWLRRYVVSLVPYAALCYDCTRSNLDAAFQRCDLQAAQHNTSRDRLSGRWLESLSTHHMVTDGTISSIVLVDVDNRTTTG